MPIQLRSGSLHYFRVHPSYWRDRLQRMQVRSQLRLFRSRVSLPATALFATFSCCWRIVTRELSSPRSRCVDAVATHAIPSQAMGLNAVQFYVPWNWHETSPGVFDFTSPQRNLATWFNTIQELGMVGLIRAGPYICGAWRADHPALARCETSCFPFGICRGCIAFTPLRSSRNTPSRLICHGPCRRMGFRRLSVVPHHCSRHPGGLHSVLRAAFNRVSGTSSITPGVIHAASDTATDLPTLAHT